jgi:hypothetical protein
MWRDAYEYRVEVEAAHPDGEAVGTIEVYAPQVGRVLDSREVDPTNGEPEVISGRFDVPGDLEGHLLEVRTYYQGVGELTIHSVELLAPS